MAALNFLANVGSNNFVMEGIITANGSSGSAGQVLASGGPSSNVHWITGGGGGGGGPYGSDTQIAFNNAGNEIGDANLVYDLVNSTMSVSNTINLGNSTVNSQINSTVYTGTAYNTLSVGATSAANVVSNAQLSGNLASYQTTAGLGANVTTLTANDTLFVGTVSAANVVSNAQLSSNLARYQTTAGLAAAVAVLPANNSNYLGGVVAASYANTTNTSATNITSGTLPWGQAPAGTANTSAVQTFAANTTFSANVLVSGIQLEIGAAANNITINSTVILVGNSTIFSTQNSTVFSQTANNATNLGGTIAASYANTTNTSATNITTGTLPWGQAPIGTVNTSGNFTLAGNTTFSANVILQGTLAANGGVGTSGQLLTSNGTTGSPYWSTVAGGGAIGLTTQIAYNNAGTESGDANLTWTTGTGTLQIGNSISNVIVNSTTLYIGNSTTNSTINSTGMNIIGGANGLFVAANGNVGIGSLVPTSPLHVIGQSRHTVTAVIGVVTAATSNVTINTTAIAIGNSTVSATINSTVYSQTSNNATNLGGIVAASYANTTNTSATNITSGTLPWSQAPSGTVNTSGNFTLAGNTTFGANVTLSAAAGQIVLQGGLGAGGNVITNSTAIFVGNSTANTIINYTTITTSNLALGTRITANGTVGTAGQSLVSGGASANAYWGTAGATGAIGSDKQIAFNNATVESGDANLLWYTANGTIAIANGQIIGGVANSVTSNTTTINIGNSTIFSTVNSTVFSQTANNASYLGTVVASSYANTTNTSATNITSGTLPWTQAPAGTANTSAVQTFAGNTTFSANVLVSGIQLEVGAAANNVTINSTVMLVGNSTVFSTQNSSVFSQTANNATNLGGVVAASYANTTNTSATNITSGTLPWAQAPSGTANTSAVQTFAGNTTFSANVTVSGLQFEVGAAANNVTVNTTAVLIGNSTVLATVNSTVFSQTANNASNLGGTVAASYANTTNTSATNITSGTLPWSQAPTGTVNTSGNFTMAGNTTFSANVLVSGIQLEVGAAANNVTINSTVMLVGNSTVFSTQNSTIFSQTANNATNLGGTVAASYANTTNTSATNITSGTLPWAQAPAGTANTSAVQTFAGNTTFSANVTVSGLQFEVGAAANNITVNTTAILLGNSTVFSTVNSTIFTQTANNSTNLGGVVAASYANTTNTSATNITSGTLPWAQAPTGTANTSAVQTFAGNTTFSANVLVSGLQLEVGAAANNITVNTTAVLLGNSTVFSIVNSTVFTQTSNNSTNLGGTVAASYANTTNTSATNITAGTLPWAQAPAGTVNTSGAFTIAGVHTHSANVILQSGLSANATFGTSGQVLTSNGTTGSPYWATAAGGATGSNTQIAYNNSGTEAGDANLTWNNSTIALTVGNSTVNTTVNSSYVTIGNASSSGDYISIGNTTVNTYINTTAIILGNSSLATPTINTTTYTGTANNATNLGGVIAASYANTTNTSATNITSGTLPWSVAPVGTVNTSGAFTIAGVFTHSANVILQSGLSANATFGTSGQVLASNGTTGSPYWITLPGSGPIGSTTQIAYNNSGTESGDANLVWNNGATANLIVNGSIATKTFFANALVGTAGQALLSGGSGANVYWGTVSGGGATGANLQIAFNNAGTEAGDANLTWQTTNTLLCIGNTVTSNVQINSTAISIGNTTSSTGTLTVGNSTVNTAITATGITTSNTFNLGSATVAANGYCWLPNGLMLNWGSTTAANSTGIAVTFSAAFPTAVYGIQVTSILGATYVPFISANSTTGCTIKTSNATNTTTMYLAIGH